jgi:hypothetical protein
MLQKGRNGPKKREKKSSIPANRTERDRLLAEAKVQKLLEVVAAKEALKKQRWENEMK